MKTYSLTQLSDQALLRSSVSVIARERGAMPWHWPAMPRRSNASLKVAVSRAAARSVLRSVVRVFMVLQPLSMCS